MSLFSFCSQCGRKCFSLALTSEGLCSRCDNERQIKLQEERERQDRLIQQKHEEDIAKAERLYSDLVMFWKSTGSDCYHSFPQCETLDEATRIVADCGKFLQLLDTIPEHPGFQEVFESQCSSIGATVCLNKDFGALSVSQVDEKTIKLDFDQLARKVSRCSDQASEVVQCSRDFQELLQHLNRVEIHLDPSAEAHPRKAAGFFEAKNITTRTRLDSLNPFYSVDVETTGLNPETCEIIQLSAIRFVNFEPVDAFTTYVKPRGGIKPHAQAVNGITAKDIENAPYIEAVSKAFMKFITPDLLAKRYPPVVGHNLSFDCNFLTANGMNTLCSMRNHYDTLEMSRREYAKRSSYKLDDMTKTVLHIVRSDAHNSLSDALATGLLFKKICKARIGF